MRSNGYLKKVEESIRNSEAYRELIDEAGGLSKRYVEKQLDRFLRIIRIGLDENVMEISRRELDELIDAGKMGDVFRMYVDNGIYGGDLTSPQTTYRIIKRCMEKAKL